MAKDAAQLQEMTVAELREEAKAGGITGTSHMRKEELVGALHDAGETTAKTRGAAHDAPDAVMLLIEDHRRVKKLFEEALQKESGDENMAALAQQIIAELELHTQVEEQLFYPALKAKAIDEDEDEAKDEVLEAYVEHDSVKGLIAKIKASSPKDESYKALVKVMSEQVDHHVEEEESEMFKQAKELLGAEKLAELGHDIAAMKSEAGAR